MKHMAIMGLMLAFALPAALLSVAALIRREGV